MTKTYRETDKQGRHVWRLRAWDGERQVSETIRTPPGPNKGIKAAERADRAFAARVRSGTPQGPLTLEKLSERWLASLEGRLSPTTLRDYHGKMKIILANLGPLRIDQIRPYELDEFYQAEGARVAPATVLKYHRILSSMMRQAERWDLLSESPARNARPPRSIRPRTVTPGIEVVLALVRAADDERMALYILLAAALGARRGELCALRWEDIDADTVSIRRSAYEAAGGGVALKDPKTDKSRVISLDPRASSALERIRGAGFIFSDDGEVPWRPDRVSKEFAKVRRRVPAAAGVRLHDLRHFHASQLIAAGFDPAAVSERLGHSSITTTLAIYTHALSERDRAASSYIGELLSGDSSEI